MPSSTMLRKLASAAATWQQRPQLNHVTQQLRLLFMQRRRRRLSGVDQKQRLHYPQMLQQPRMNLQLHLDLQQPTDRRRLGHVYFSRLPCLGYDSTLCCDCGGYCCDTSSTSSSSSTSVRQSSSRRRSGSTGSSQTLPPAAKWRGGEATLKTREICCATRCPGAQKRSDSRTGNRHCSTISNASLNNTGILDNSSSSTRATAGRVRYSCCVGDNSSSTNSSTTVGRGGRYSSCVGDNSSSTSSSTTAGLRGRYSCWVGPVKVESNIVASGFTLRRACCRSTLPSSRRSNKRKPAAADVSHLPSVGDICLSGTHHLTLPLLFPKTSRTTHQLEGYVSSAMFSRTAVVPAATAASAAVASVVGWPMLFPPIPSNRRLLLAVTKAAVGVTSAATAAHELLATLPAAAEPAFASERKGGLPAGPAGKPAAGRVSRVLWRPLLSAGSQTSTAVAAAQAHTKAAAARWVSSAAAVAGEGETAAVKGGVATTGGVATAAAAKNTTEEDNEEKEGERETIEVDVLIVGGGVAGLSAAIRLKQLELQYHQHLLKQHQEHSPGSSGSVSSSSPLCPSAPIPDPLRVCVIDKGAAVGAHVLSGNIFDPTALDELFPEWRHIKQQQVAAQRSKAVAAAAAQDDLPVPTYSSNESEPATLLRATAAALDGGPPVETLVSDEQLLLLLQHDPQKRNIWLPHKALDLPLTLLPRKYKNTDSSYIINLGELCAWMARVAEEIYSIDIFPGFAAAELLGKRVDEPEHLPPVPLSHVFPADAVIPGACPPAALRVSGSDRRQRQQQRKRQHKRLRELQVQLWQQQQHQSDAAKGQEEGSRQQQQVEQQSWKELQESWAEARGHPWYICGVRLAAAGLQQDGRRTEKYVPGLNIKGKQVLLAEGCCGSLSEHAIAFFGLRQTQREFVAGAAATAAVGSVAATAAAAVTALTGATAKATAVAAGVAGLSTAIGTAITAAAAAAATGELAAGRQHYVAQSNPAAAATAAADRGAKPQVFVPHPRSEEQQQQHKQQLQRAIKIQQQQHLAFLSSRGVSSSLLAGYERSRYICWGGRRTATRYRCPQTYAIGLKEVWEVLPDKHMPGKVIHTVGWPLRKEEYGGGFIYHLASSSSDSSNENSSSRSCRVLLGLVLGLDYSNPHLRPYEEFQQWKTHPAVAQVLEGGTCISYGARCLNEGGWQAVPKLSFPGGLLLGGSAGLLDVPRLKGSHTAMKSGIVAAEALATQLFFPPPAATSPASAAAAAAVAAAARSWELFKEKSRSFFAGSPEPELRQHRRQRRWSRNTAAAAATAEAKPQQQPEQQQPQPQQQQLQQQQPQKQPEGQHRQQQQQPQPQQPQQLPEGQQQKARWPVPYGAEIFAYEEQLRDSWVFTDLYRSRNVRPSFRKGLLCGLLGSFFFTSVTRGREPFTFLWVDRDSLRTAAAAAETPIHYPPHDGVLTFDLMDSVARSNTMHAPGQPSHLKLRLWREDVPADISYERFAGIEARLCPAGVYEFVEAPEETEQQEPRRGAEATAKEKQEAMLRNHPLFASDRKKKKGKQMKLQINAQNCVHCKCCAIKAAKDCIVWTVPEGGDGPRYSGM